MNEFRVKFFINKLMGREINCKFCGANFFVRKGKIRSNRKILASQVLECTRCSFVCLNDTTHISDQHYRDSFMHTSPISLVEWRAQTKVDDLRRLMMLKEKIKGLNLLEVGCGNAGFLKLAEPLTKSIAGIEPENKHKLTFSHEGLNIFNVVEDYKDSPVYSEIGVDAIVSFHVIEHLVDPINFLISLFNLLKTGGKVFIETPNSNDALIKLYDSSAFQDFTYWDNHLSLFNKKSFEFILNKFKGIIYKSIPVQRYGIANHLYWLSSGKPGGHIKYDCLEDDLINEQYKQKLFNLGMTDTLFHEITKIDSKLIDILI